MKYSKHGYKRNSKDVNNPYNVIPSGNITMKGVDFPVMGTDNLGNQKLMMPGANYTFPGNSVYEVPLQNFPRHIQAQRGFEIAQDARIRNDVKTGQSSAADAGADWWSAIKTGTGVVADYKYSKALASFDKEWTFEELNGYLIKPAKWIKGTKMAFAGLRKEKDRASVIKYLNQNSDNPVPLP